MTLYIVVATYILSVALYIVVNRAENRATNYTKVHWFEVVISIIPVFNIIVAILMLIETWSVHDYAMPRWLTRLYGGR